MKDYFQLVRGEQLNADEFLTSMWGQFKAQLQKADGNFVVVDYKTVTPLWATGAPKDYRMDGLKLSLGNNGVLRLTNGNADLSPAAWRGIAGDTLVMQNDGNLVFYTNGKPLWASGTVRYTDDFSSVNGSIFGAMYGLQGYFQHLADSKANVVRFVPPQAIPADTGAAIPTGYFAGNGPYVNRETFGVLFLKNEAINFRNPSRAELAAPANYRAVWGGINAYAVQASSGNEVGAFPTSCIAIEKAPQPTPVPPGLFTIPAPPTPTLADYTSFPCVCLKKEFADFQDIPAESLMFTVGAGKDARQVNSINPDEMLRAVGKYATDHGYLGGFPTYQSTVRNGKCVHGAILIKKSAGVWMDVTATGGDNGK